MANFKVAKIANILVKLTNDENAPNMSGVYNLTKKTLLITGITWAKAVPDIIVTKLLEKSLRK